MRSPLSHWAALGLPLLLCACRSPLPGLKPPAGSSLALQVPPVEMENHSRCLARLQDPHGAADTPEARQAALEAHRQYLDSQFRRRAEAKGQLLDSKAPYRLNLRVTTLGEVRTSYIVYGILSGVAWGVGTGLATHSAKLALCLGGYELVEESVFWIGGSSLFGRFSAPVVLEATLSSQAPSHPVWSETYFVLSGGQHLKDYPEAQRRDRECQLHASLDKALDKLFEDLDLFWTGHRENTPSSTP